MVRSAFPVLVLGSFLLVVGGGSRVSAQANSAGSESLYEAVAQAPSEDESTGDAAKGPATPEKSPTAERMPAGKATSAGADFGTGARAGQPRETGAAFAEMVENIVVTSRKRRESIQSIPVSVTALSDTSLKQLGVRRVQDIADSVPNLEYAPTSGSGNSARANIRGVGQSDQIGSLDPGVGLYVDGVYMARLQSGLLNTSDVERIEVVRGPQGTIFGKNTIGGAVSIVTRLPQFERSGSLEVRAGNFDLFETRAVLNVPLVEEVAALRLSVATATRDGFSKDRLGGSDPNDDKLLAGRAQLLVLPTDTLEIRLSGDVSRENKTLDAGKCVVQNTGGNALLQLSNAIVGFTDACAETQRSNNPRRVETDLSFLRDDLTSYGGSAQLIWALGPQTELRSLSSVRGLDNQSFADFDGTRIELLRPAIDAGGFEQTQISQEFQLSTSLLDDRLNVVAGVFGFKEQSKDTTIEGVLSRLSAADIVDVIPGIGPVDDQMKAVIADAVRGAQVRAVNRVDNLSYSAYAQVSYDLTEKLNLSAGLRLTQERKRLLRSGLALTSGQGLAIPADGSTNGMPAQLQAGDTAFFFERSDRFSDLTPSASISYQFTPTALGYLNYSTGFKSGGFNGRALPPLGSSEATFPLSVDPEELTTYEIGFKASFLDQRVALNAAAFYSIYEDIQLIVLPGDPSLNTVPILLVNAGEAIVSGGELELTISPIPNLRIRTSLGVLNDRFTDFDDPSDPRAKDRGLPFLSAYETSTSVEYAFDLARIGSVSARVDWNTRSRQFFSAENSDSLEAGKRGLLNARLGVVLVDGVTELAVFGRNLTDREYLISGVDFGNTFGSALRFVGPPRTYGVELKRRF